MHHQLIWENRGVLSQYHGTFTTENHEIAINSLFADPRIDDISYIITDYSRLNADLLSDYDVDYAVAMLKGAASYLKTLKIALVATDQKFIDFCTRFIERLLKLNIDWKIQLFDDIDSANYWVSTDNQNYSSASDIY